jgi:hypothetical protein
MFENIYASKSKLDLMHHIHPVGDRSAIYKHQGIGLGTIQAGRIGESFSE